MTILNLDYTYPMKNSGTSQRVVSFQGTSNQQIMSIGEDINTVTTATTDTTTTTKHTSSAMPGTSKSTSAMAASSKQLQTRAGKRPGRKPSKINERDKLERSRQSARECRARKKLRYQYLEELVINREKAVFALRDELKMYKGWCSDVDRGDVPGPLIHKMQLDLREASTSYQQSSSSEDDEPEIVCFSPYNDLEMG